MSTDEPSTLLVIDGHSLAFRAFYALPVENFSTRDGQYTNAIHGFVSMLLLLLQNEKPTHIAVAFDRSRVSFRTKEYAEYKGTRGETPPEFKGQVPILQEALTAMGITVLDKEDFEADDILATLAARGEAAGWRVLVVSGDRDTIQLVNEKTTLLYPNSQGVSQLKRYDPAAVLERYGIEPHQYPDVAALVGETSDNLPGISKVGEKTAVKWLLQYGSLAGILEHIDEIRGVVGDNLRRERDNAERNRRLNELVRDVELDIALDDLRLGAIDVERVRPIFERLEFRTLLERLAKLAAGEPTSIAAGRQAGGARAQAPVVFAGSAPAGGVAGVETPIAPPLPVVTALTNATVEQWLTAANAAQPAGLGLWIETIGGVPSVLGLATTTETATINWAPGASGHDALTAWLVSDAPKIMVDAKPKVRALAAAGVTLGGLVLDPLLAGWMARPNLSERSLADLVEYYLGEQMPQPDPSLLVPIEGTETGPAEFAWYTARVAREVLLHLSEGERALLHRVEMPLIAVLGAMETRGVHVDRGILGQLSTELGETANSLATAAYAQIGREVNLGSPKQLQEVLFNELGMPKTRATKTGYSTDAASLADLQESNPHPFLGLLLEHRDATKLKQIVESLDKTVGRDGRVHTTYGQIGAATGRMSSNDPNLQNIPIRTAEGRRIRSAFRHGAEFDALLTADYSQIEMRIMAHLSNDAGLIEAFNLGEDLHRFVGARIFGVEPADVTNEMRTKVKAMSYGLAYGLSAFGLSKQLRIDRAEAKRLMEDYFARFGAVRTYLRGVVEQAREDGYTETIMGRRRPFPDLNSPNRIHRENAERAALNSPIQGSAADIIKVAMTGIEHDLADAGLRSRMLMQVHDELVFEIANAERDQVESIVRRRMAGAADLQVPLDVQVGVGPDWDSAAH